MTTSCGECGVGRLDGKDIAIVSIVLYCLFDNKSRDWILKSDICIKFYFNMEK